MKKEELNKKSEKRQNGVFSEERNDGLKENKGKEM